MMTGDMPQQAKHSGFARHNLTYGYRYCCNPAIEKNDLQFDIVGMRRHHWQTIPYKQSAKALRGK